MKYLARSGRRNVNILTIMPDGTLPANAVIFRAIEGKEGFSLKDFFARGDDDDEEDEQPKKKENPKDKKQKAKPKPKTKTKHIEPLLSDDEEAFVRNGGRFVIAVGGRYDINLSTRNVVPAKKATKVFPIWPGIDQILLPNCRTLLATDALRRAHVLYAIDNDPAIARVLSGKGELILIAAPELFDNAHVAQHLDLLTALAGDRRIVYFDETVHGMLSQTGTLDLLRQWRLGPTLVLLLLIAIVMMWRGARRVGHAEDDYRDTRSDAVDLVSSLGALYDESTSRAEALALYHQALTQSVAAQTGLRGEALHKRVSKLTNDLRPPQKSERVEIEDFNAMLTTLNEGFRRLEHAEHH
jgi:hypothetical protein